MEMNENKPSFDMNLFMPVKKVSMGWGESL